MCLIAPGTLAAAQAAEEALLRDSAELAYREGLMLRLPAIEPRRHDAVHLAFEARIETRFKSGSAPAAQICVNGLPTSIERLRNKPRYYFFTGRRRVPWYSPALAAWVLPYCPWENRAVAEGFAHRYVLDIRDLLKPADNAVTFESLYDAAPGAVLQFRNIRLLFHRDFPKSPRLSDKEPLTASRGLARFRAKATGYHRGAEAALQPKTAYKDHVGVVAPRDGFDQPYKLDVDATGRIRITVGRDRYEAYSWFRAPGDEWMTIGQDGGSRGWAACRVDGHTVLCDTPQLALRRTIKRNGSHVEIEDRVVNRTDADLPVAFLNAVDVGDVAGIIEFRIAGQAQRRFWANTSPMVGRQTGATPVVYVARGASAVGLVMEDDAYRNQGSVLVWDNTVGLGDGMFYLGPKASYTFVWKIFPLAERNYYTLVNAVRHDWQLFGHIPGLFGFVHPSTKERMYEDVRCKDFREVADWLATTGIEIASTSLVVPLPGGKQGPLYGNEAMAVLRAGVGDFTRWRTEVRRHGARVRCLPYVNVHLSRIVPGRTLADLDERLPGCLVRDAYGDPVAYRAGWLYCVLPTLGNACGRHLLDVLRFMMDEERFDGIYLDEWDHSRARVTFAHEDGMSALVDADGRLVRKVGFVPILAKPFHVKFAEELTKRKAVIFANQFDDTLAAARLPIVHFAEPGGSYDEYLLAAAQCSRTPLALHVKRTSGIWTDAKEFLKRGLLMCYYWKYLHGDHVLKRCFPITVREIWPGVVIGEDRIVTCASGTFTLGRDAPLTAYVYSGPDGKLAVTVPGNATVDGHRAVRLDLTDDRIAVIVEHR